MGLPAQKPTAAPAAAAAQKPAAAPAAAKPVAAAAPLGPQVRRLKRGELLFAEGENSRAMYFLKTGMIRIFKKKGESSIEIDTVRSGSVIGELAFLDGNPRSASGEALTDCELMEISGPTFQAVLGNMPDWLKILLKTVVGRLRTASTRIRQLETASSAVDYNDKDGKRNYVYLSANDVLKICSAIVLVSAKNGTQTAEGIEIKMALVQRYGNNIMGVPIAKITTFLDILVQVGAATVQGEEKAFIKDLPFIEAFIAYYVEESLLEPSKRHDLTLKGFVVMSMLAKHLHKYKKDENSGMANVNVAEIKTLETPPNGKEPFRMEEFPELQKLGYCTQINIKAADAMFTQVKPESFMHAYRMQRIVMAVGVVNEQKRKGAGVQTGK